jgi:hypothetical protein
VRQVEVGRQQRRLSPLTAALNAHDHVLSHAGTMSSLGTSG